MDFLFNGAKHLLKGRPPVSAVAETNGLAVPWTSSGRVGDAEKRDLIGADGGSDMADARVIGNDDAGALGQSCIIAQCGGRKNSGVRTGRMISFLFAHGGKDDGFDAPVAKRSAEFVEVLPCFSLP